MRKLSFVFLALVAGCTTGANHVGNPLLLPLRGIGAGVENAAYNRTRGQVEIFVKTNHPALIADIQRGGGPALTEAQDIAGVPLADRELHAMRLKSDLPLYNANPGALIVAIMVAAP